MGLGPKAKEDLLFRNPWENEGPSSHGFESFIGGTTKRKMHGEKLSLLWMDIGI